MKILLTAINAKYIHSNLAVYNLKTYAGKYGNINDIELYETTINNRYEDIFREIYEQKPDVIAFSCYIWNVEIVMKLVGELKKVLKDVAIWIGGPEVSYNATKILEDNENIDIVMCGEGEQTFLELCESDGSDYQSIEGICYRDKNGNICANKWRQPLQLSKIPFPYEDINNLENRIVYYESSRGCPFSCSYCLSSVDKSLRFRDIEIVKKELSYFIEKKVPLVKFVDRTFNCKPEHAINIWKYIMENDKGITRFHFEVAADIITEEELEIMEKMRPGLIQLEVGVQSVHEATIKEIKRSMKLSKVRDVVKRIHQMKNIHAHLDLIAGLPFEDYEMFKESFDEVYKMKPNQLQLGFLKVLKGSYMYEHAEEYGIVYSSYAPYEVMHTKWISYEEVLKLKMVEEVVEIYYNSGQFVYSMKYLDKYFSSPFELYYSIGRYYDENFSRTAKHSRIERYHILRKFYREMESREEKRKLFDEIMSYDIYLRENMHTRPEFCVEVKEYKDDIRKIIKWLDLTRSEHVEPVSEDMYQFLCNEDALCNAEFMEGNEELKSIYFVFDYKKREPLFGNGSVICLKNM